MVALSRCIVLWMSFVGLVSSQDLLAELDYGTFKGAYSAKYNISYWQKIPFAAPPTGENRFRAPQPPAPVNGTYDSSKAFDMCPQRTNSGSEDCLYLGLYSRPWAKGQSLRPVVVVFYGGGFIEGGASFNLPPSAYPVLNVSTRSDLVFVYPNYRVNAFGLLAGREVQADAASDANAGLLDQEAALLWTQKYAANFGGDPARVAVWGQSAGGGSVVAQVIARPHQPKLFQRALASSPYWPKTYRWDAPETQWIYDALVNRTGCAGAADTLACLKAADVQALREASLYLAGTHTYNTSSYTWAPVIDDRFLPLTLTEAAAAGAVNPEVGFGMYNLHEGENFIPHVGSDADFDAWLAGFLPDLAAADLDQAKQLYPATGAAETLSYSTPSVRAGLVYRDVILACPAYWMAAAAPNGSWLGEYTISPAKHASDTYWWDTVSSAQQTDPVHYEGYAGAFSSFFVDGDPNSLKLTASDVPGVPSLGSGAEFVIDAAGFGNANITQLEQRCSFWRSVAPKIPV